MVRRNVSDIGWLTNRMMNNLAGVKLHTRDRKSVV